MGVDLINDVSGFRSKEALDFLKAMEKNSNWLLYYAHARKSKTMQDSPRYGDVVSEVEFFCKERLMNFEIRISEDRILIDPGLASERLRNIIFRY